MTLDVALVSCSRLPEPDPDAEPLLAALVGAGVSARVMAWDDPLADWSQARLTVLRSSWNYPHHLPEFLQWAERTAQLTELWNPLPVVRWNSHKKYLLELERAGLPITPTILVPRGDSRTLRRIMEKEGWTEVVVKPAVSASSFQTLRVGKGQIEAGEKHLGKLLVDRDVLVQAYMPSVESHGERALIWIDGSLTHAVQKTPRFENDLESVAPEPVPIDSLEASLAHRCIEAAPRPLLYARIDMTRDVSNIPVLMELELVEPSLYFIQSSHALTRFVSAITKRL